MIQNILIQKIYLKKHLFIASRNGRELIKNNKIQDFIYAKLKKNIWNISVGKSYKYDKILLKKSLVDTIPEIRNPITYDNKYEVIPDIILFKNYEKIKDNDGNIIDIETRGIKPNIYLKVKDIITTFDIAYLDKHIIDKDEFIENQHYKFFSYKTAAQKITIKKELYLTYEGMLRVLFASHNKKVKQFISWATETLFTVQLGEREDKELLSSNLLGVNVKNIKSVFSTNSNKTPCVYLFIIGQANELLKSKKYNDSDYIFKFGYTNDLVRRTNEHYKTYKNEFNKEIQLVIFSIIDSSI